MFLFKCLGSIGEGISDFIMKDGVVGTCGDVCC